MIENQIMGSSTFSPRFSSHYDNIFINDSEVQEDDDDDNSDNDHIEDHQNDATNDDDAAVADGGVDDDHEYFRRIPNEVLEQILSHMLPKEICHVASVCRFVYK